MIRADLKKEARRIWLQRSGWPPITPTGLLFMGEAIESLGKSIYPDTWSGREPCAWVPGEHHRPSSVDAGKIAEWEQQRASALDSVDRWNGVWKRICQWVVDADLPVAVRSDSGNRLDVRASQFAADERGSRFGKQAGP